MRGLSIWLLAGMATPAIAQHSGHSEPPAPAQDTSCTPEHAAMGHCTPRPPAQTADDPHAGHQMPAEEQPAADPHAGHRMGTVPQPPKAPPPPEALSGPEHAADLIYDPARMAASREEMRREHGGLRAYRIFIERAETRIRDGRDGYLLDGQGWYGGDIDKIWLKGEVDGTWGERPKHAEIQALWSHAIDPWFDVQTGVRYDPQPGPDRAHLVLGVQGLAPYWWEVDAALFLSNKGEVTARAEAEYDLRITQKLIFQPRAELDFSLQSIRELEIGAGLSQAALGARLRYQLSPLFAPYVGVEYERAFGKTADFRRAEGKDTGAWNLLAGLRWWF
jgi:copper resistance protein B